MSTIYKSKYKTVTAKKAKPKGYPFKKVVDVLTERPRTFVQDMKNKYYRKLAVNVKPFQDWADKHNAVVVRGKTFNERLAQMAKSGQQSWQRYASAMNEYTKAAGSMDTPGHSGVSNLQLHLRAALTSLEEMQVPLHEIYKDARNTGNSRMAVSFTEKYKLTGFGRKNEGTEGGFKEENYINEEWDIKNVKKFYSQSDLDFQIDSLRELHAASVALEMIPANSIKTASWGELQTVVKEVLSTSEGQTEFIANKNKDVDILNKNGTLLEMVVETKAWNVGIKGKLSRDLGEEFQNLNEKTQADWTKHTKNNLGLVTNVIPIHLIEGSKSIGEEVVSQLVDIATTGKARKYKKTGTERTTKNTRGKAPASLKPLKRKNKMQMVPPARGRGANKSNESGGDAVELQRLQKAINKRLPAEVRRNMGTPALTNRTGRFSNSALVTRLSKSAGGIGGDYTYLLNPYQTFENTGQKRWPNGYNPKSVITKSIRNLAMQYTDEKFTYLRRT